MVMSQGLLALIIEGWDPQLSDRSGYAHTGAMLCPLRLYSWSCDCRTDTMGADVTDLGMSLLMNWISWKSGISEVRDMVLIASQCWPSKQPMSVTFPDTPPLRPQTVGDNTGDEITGEGVECDDATRCAGPINLEPVHAAARQWQLYLVIAVAHGKRSLRHFCNTS